MRLSSNFLCQQNIKSMNDAMTRFYNVENQLSAGRTVLRPSDDPAAASQAISLQSALSSLDQYDTARMYAQDALSLEDNTLSSISNILCTNLTEKIVAGGDGALSDEARQDLAKELQGIKDSLLDLANTKNSSGNYIFSGYATSTAPFDEKGDYQGSDTALTQDVADSTTMAVGHTGSSLFMSGTSDDIFKALDKAITALNTPVASDADRDALNKALDEANISIKHGIDNLGKIQAEVGTNLQQIDLLNTTAATKRIQLSDSLSETLGEDPETWTQLYSTSQAAKFSMQTSMDVFKAMQQSSIFSMP